MLKTVVALIIIFVNQTFFYKILYFILYCIKKIKNNIFIIKKLLSTKFFTSNKYLYKYKLLIKLNELLFTYLQDHNGELLAENSNLFQCHVKNGTELYCV